MHMFRCNVCTFLERTLEPVQRVPLEVHKVMSSAKKATLRFGICCSLCGRLRRMILNKTGKMTPPWGCPATDLEGFVSKSPIWICVMRSV